MNFLVELGPDRNEGVFSVDDCSCIAEVCVHSRLHASSWCPIEFLLDLSSSQTFMWESVLRLMTSSSADDIVLERRTPPKVWSNFGNHELLTTTTSFRLIVEFLRGDQPPAPLAVSVYVVYDGTMQHTLLMGRDSPTRFIPHSYRTLPCDTPSYPLLGELTLQHFDET